MADYAGAVAAIEARLREQWGTSTPLGVENGLEPNKQDAEGDPVPWVELEVSAAGAELIGVGKPGDQVSVQEGLIEMHVFVPTGTGTAIANQHAVALGEIFRTKQFYDTEPGHAVRSWTPRISGPESGSDDGLWFRVTCTVPFEYIHRG